MVAQCDTRNRKGALVVAPESIAASSIGRAEALRFLPHSGNRVKEGKFSGLDKSLYIVSPLTGLGIGGGAQLAMQD